MSGRFAPALRDSLHRYSWKAFRSDLGAGLTVGIILSVPMVLAGAWLLWRGLRSPVSADAHEPA